MSRQISKRQPLHPNPSRVSPGDENKEETENSTPEVAELMATEVKRPLHEAITEIRTAIPPQVKQEKKHNKRMAKHL